MKFLLTNDDGIYARGLSTLYEELSKDAECLIVAPEVEQSAVGHSITIFRPLMVRKANRNGKFLGYAVAGTPADCVKIGVRELSEGPIDLVVSGINKGANVGINVLYSGTVSAATEGIILGIPSLALSLNTQKEADFSFAARFARKMCSFVAQNGPFHGTVLNVNIPALPEEEIKGIVVTRQGQAKLWECFDKRIDPRENIYYWLTGETECAPVEEADSDVSFLRQGMITITPLHYDLTHHYALPELEGKVKKNLQINEILE